MINSRFLSCMRWDKSNVEDLIKHLADHNLHILDATTSLPADRERVVNVMCGKARGE